MKFTSVLAIVACAITAQAATVANVLADIAVIKTGVVALNSKLQAYPLTGGTLANALAIHTAAAALVAPINAAKNDAASISPLPVSVGDATLILNALDDVKPTILAALTRIVVIKPAFVALPVGGLPALVKVDLANLNAATGALADALIVNTPASLLARAVAIKSTIVDAFGVAIVAYA